MEDSEKNLPLISDGELEVMKVLWQLKEATSGEIIETLLPNTQWKAKTIQTMINRLVQKGAIKADKGQGRNYRYTPLVLEDDYKLNASRQFVNKVYDGSLSLLVAGFVKNQTLSAEEISKLRTLLEDGE